MLACVALAAHAGKVYRWVDKNGVVHYGDRPPPDAAKAGAQVKVIPVRAEPGAMARLRMEREEGASLAFADNTVAGPVEVLLKFTTAPPPRFLISGITACSRSALLTRLRLSASSHSARLEFKPLSR